VYRVRRLWMNSCGPWRLRIVLMMRCVVNMRCVHCMAVAVKCVPWLLCGHVVQFLFVFFCFWFPLFCSPFCCCRRWFLVVLIAVFVLERG